MDKIIALYNSLEEYDFVEASIDSIYSIVDKIVFLFPKTNEYHDRVKNYMIERDIDNKFIGLYENSDDSMDQQRIGVTWINQNIAEFDYILLISNNEIWDDKNIIKLLEELIKFPCYKSALNCHVFIYEKTPFYRRYNVLNKYPILLKKGIMSIEEVKTVILESVTYHKFFMGRDNDEKTFGISVESLPKSMLNKPSMKKYFPDNRLSLGDMEVLYECSQGKDIVVDLGTFKGCSAVILSLGANKVFSYDIFEDFLKLKFDISKIDTPKVRKDIQKVLINYDYIAYYENVKKLEQLYSNLKITKNQGKNSYYHNKESIDLLFVDTEHDYHNIIDEFTAYKEKVKPGGLILFHDYSNHHPQVIYAVNAIINFDGYKLSELNDKYNNTSIKIIEKPL